MISVHENSKNFRVTLDGASYGDVSFYMYMVAVD